MNKMEWYNSYLKYRFKLVILLYIQKKITNFGKIFYH
jgi:hypothetical protein